MEIYIIAKQTPSIHHTVGVRGSLAEAKKYLSSIREGYRMDLKLAGHKIRENIRMEDNGTSLRVRKVLRDNALGDEIVYTIFLFNSDN